MRGCLPGEFGVDPYQLYTIESAHYSPGIIDSLKKKQDAGLGV